LSSNSPGLSKLEETPVDRGNGDTSGVARATFYYDLGSPYAYLSAERISGLFTEAGLEQPEWQPILLGGLFQQFGRSSWGQSPEREAGMAECERRASAYGLPPIAWPDPWPGNMLTAMRVATFAKQTGRAVSFSLAAFRQQFAAGRDLGDPDNVMIAGAACELHPRALLKAVETKSVKDALRAATDVAAACGVEGVPAVVVGEQVFWGDDRLEEAVEAAGS
jgi:2-hydroxychromene-2-carboxylate isomerase